MYIYIDKMTTENKTLRCWRDDYRIAEEFCEKYGLCYQECLDHREPYSVFFIDVDGDEICCCVSKNTEKSFEKGIVHEEDIVLYIPLNERDLKKDLYQKLLEFCTKNDIIST